VPILDLFTDKEIFYDYRLNSALIKRPTEEEILNSPTRFTWEYQNPAFYTPKGKTLPEETAIVVISDTPAPELPEYVRQRIKDKRIYRIFKRYTPGMLKYRTIVTIYN